MLAIQQINSFQPMKNFALKRVLFLVVCSLALTKWSFADKIVKDSNSIYAHAFESLVSIVTEQTTGPVPTLVLSADQFILSRIPDSYQGISVAKRSKYKPNSKFEQAIWLRVEHFVLDQDRLYVFARIQTQANGVFVNWKPEVAAYKLTYRCNFKDNTFDLVDYSESEAVQK